MTVEIAPNLIASVLDKAKRGCGKKPRDESETEEASSSELHTVEHLRDSHIILLLRRNPRGSLRLAVEYRRQAPWDLAVCSLAQKVPRYLEKIGEALDSLALPSQVLRALAAP